MWTFKLAMLAAIFLMTIVSGFYPFFQKWKTTKVMNFPISESLAAGVFLSVSLIHMLGDASGNFYRLNVKYPMAFLLAGCMFLFLLWLEHIGRELNTRKGEASGAFAVLATIMLSVHAFLMGVALGLIDKMSVAVVIFFAIIAHKWAESFSLAIQIHKSPFNFKKTLFLFGFFSLMTPLGILLGTSATTFFGNYPLLAPVFSSLAAGTFLYLGTLHGLEKATLIRQCCDLKRFYFVILGFAIMAVVAIWT